MGRHLDLRSGTARDREDVLRRQRSGARWRRRRDGSRIDHCVVAGVDRQESRRRRGPGSGDRSDVALLGAVIPLEEVVDSLDRLIAATPEWDGPRPYRSLRARVELQRDWIARGARPLTLGP